MKKERVRQNNRQKTSPLSLREIILDCGSNASKGTKDRNITSDRPRSHFNSFPVTFL